MKKLLFVACALMMAGAASAAGMYDFGGLGAETEVFGEDTTLGNYALYAITKEDTSASELAKYFAGVSFAEFKKEADANAMTYSSTLSALTISLNGDFSDSQSRKTYLDDNGISHGLYAVVVHDDAQFKVMESSFLIPGRGYPIFSTDGEWVSFAAPEPTSAMLLLLGVAGLSLRRAINGRQNV